MPVLLGLTEADKAEAFAHGSTGLQVVGYELGAQVEVVVALINDLPRSIVFVI